MFNRDTLRLIRKTYKRFLTIFLMVLIGVSFMVGLSSTAPIMRKSVDVYYDEYNFMDVQLYSSYGFDEADLEYIRDLKYVEEATPTKFVDVYGQNKDRTYVTRVQEMDTDVNHYELLSGRLPEAENEALTLGSSSFGTVFEEGEVVTLYVEDGNIGDSLKESTYTIVGTVRSPQYMSSSKETSSLNNLTLEAAIYVPNEDFEADYYTSIYVTYEDAKEYVAFSKEYQAFIEKMNDELEHDVKEQQEKRKNAIMEEAQKEIAKGEKELQRQSALAQKEMAAAQKELDDGYIKLLVGEATIEQTEKQLDSGEKEIAENEKLLQQSEKELNAAIQQIEAETGKSFDEAYDQISTTYNVYVQLEAIMKADSSNEKISERIAKNEVTISELEIKNEELRFEILQMQSDGKSEEEIAVVEAQIQQNERTIRNKQNENSFLEKVSKITVASTMQGVLDYLDKQAGGSVKDAYNGMKTIHDAKAEIEAGYQKLEAAKKEIVSGREQLEVAKAEIAAAKEEYEAGAKKLQQAQNAVNRELEKARIKLDKAKQDLEELPDAEWMILDRQSHFSTLMYENNSMQMEKIGQVFPMLFFLVAALVCMTTMKRLVDEERSQIGVFSALGFTKSQIIGKYVFYAFAASILASAIGVFAGIPIFPTVIYFCWKLMYDLPQMVWLLPLRNALVGACSFTLLMVMVTAVVAYNSLKEMPSQLMRPKAPKNAKKVFLEHISFIWNRLSFTSKVTARNLIRYKSRFFMTIIGVAGCTSLLVLGFGIKDCISQVLTIQYEEIMQYDYTITLEDTDVTEDIWNRLEKDKNIEAVVPFMNYSSMVYSSGDDKTISVYVLNDDYEDIFDIRQRKNHQPLDLDDGVVISEKFAKNQGIQVGDTITFESSNGIKKEVEVAGICEMYFQHFLFITEEMYEDLFNETVYYDHLGVMPKDGAAFVEMMEDIEGVKSVTDFTAMMRTFEVMIEALDVIVLVILIAAGSLAFVVLMNLTEVNISERIREIATLKVLGFNDKEVNSYIFKEIFLLTLIGAWIGMPLGKVELTYVMNIINMEMVMFGNSIEVLSYAYGFVITLVFAIIVLLCMRGSLKKVQMVESLKSVE